MDGGVLWLEPQAVASPIRLSASTKNAIRRSQSRFLDKLPGIKSSPNIPKPGKDTHNPNSDAPDFIRAGMAATPVKMVIVDDKLELSPSASRLGGLNEHVL